MLPDEIDIARRAEELYHAWAHVEEAEPRRPAPVALADLVAFLSESKPLSHDQQRSLFSDARLRAAFQCLKSDFALAWDAQSSDKARAVEGAVRRTLEVHAQIAAASAPAQDFLRSFDGGTLRVCPAGIEAQVYIIISLDDPAIAPRALLLESTKSSRIEQMELPPRDGDGDILLIKDLAVGADIALVDLLHDPATTGTFLR